MHQLTGDPNPNKTNPWDYKPSDAEYQYLKSVDWIEDKTGYDFFSSLPINVQSAIETNSSPIFPTAPLLALNDLSKIVDNLTIGQNSVFKISTLESGINSSTQVSPLKGSFDQNGTSKIDISEVCANKATSGEVSTSKLSTHEVSILKESTVEKTISEIGFNQISSTQVSISQVDIPQVGITEDSIIKSDPFTYSLRQVGSTQIRPVQFYPIQQNTSKATFLQLSSNQESKSQVNINQLNTTQIDSAQIESTQLDLSKIPLSNRKSLQQLLSSHNYSLQNTTVPTWLEFLQGTTPFNLNIEITDLPTGQLAEANITGYDPTGRPNSGTLYLDIDANGLGWFIDPTPWENSEFSTSLTDTAYRATADSAAYGHYDLLTTLLHETAHLQGFIAGYSGFDSHIQTINGSKTLGLSEVEAFVGDGFSAILTPDGSHLDSSVYAYDVMNTTLTPSVRKLPSALDLQLLKAIQSAQFATTNRADLAPTASLTAGALIAINNGSYFL